MKTIHEGKDPEVSLDVESHVPLRQPSDVEWAVGYRSGTQRKGQVREINFGINGI